MSMTHKEMIEVIAAHEHGAKIECRVLGGGPWGTWIKTAVPSWDFTCLEYRVAQPAKVKMWQWFYIWHGDTLLSSQFFRDEQHAQCNLPHYKVIGPAKWTEIEVDAKG